MLGSLLGFSSPGSDRQVEVRWKTVLTFKPVVHENLRMNGQVANES